MSDAHPPRLAVLRRVRDRRRLLAGLATLAAAGAVVPLAVLAAAAAIGLGAPHGPVRVAVLFAAAGALAASFAWLGAAPWARTSDLLRVARAVEARLPLLYDALSTALALGPAEPGPTVDPDDVDMARLLRAQADAAASGVDPLTLVPWRLLLRPAQAAGVAALALGLGAWAWPGAVAEGARALVGRAPGLADPGGAAGAEDDGGDLVLADIALTLTPPAYSGLAPTTIDGAAGDLEALPGTRVDVRARLPAGLRDPSFTYGEGGPFTMGRVEGDRVEFAFSVASGATSYRVHARSGLRGVPRRTRAMKVRLVPDFPPTLQVAGPSPPIELQPEDPLRVVAHAEDDFGLSRVDRVVLRGGAELSRRTLARWDDRTRRADLHDDWVPGADPALQEGGLLDVVVEAWDNDTVTGPKVTRSAALRFHVLTPADHHRRVLDLKQDLKDRVVDLLGDHLVQVDDGYRELDAVGILGLHAANREEITRAFEVGAALLDALRVDPLERTLTVAEVGSVLDSVSRAWDQLDDLVEREVAPLRAGQRVRGIGGLVARQSDLVVELERAALALDRAMATQVMDELLTRTEGAEGSLADLVKAVEEARAGKGDKAALERALKELERQIAEMSRLQSRMRESPADEYVNAEVDEARRIDLAEVRELIRQGRYAEALEKLRQMSELMAKAKQGLDEMGARGGGQDGREQLARLEALAGKARELEKRQEAVLEESRALDERYGEPEEQAALDRAERKMAQLEQELTRLPATAEGLDEGLERSIVSRARRARDDIQRAREAARRGDTSGARAEARSSLEELSDLEAVLDTFGRDGRMGMSGPAGRRTGAAARQALGTNREVVEMLDGGTRQDGERRAQAGRSGAGAAGRQRGVREGVEGLREELGEASAPVLDGAKGRQRLKDAGQLMQASSEDLDGGRPGRASRSQEQAIEQLREFREDVEGARDALRQAMKGRQSGGRAGGAPRWGGYFDGQWGRTDGGDVEMPRPDEFLGPEEFRRAVMEGATEDAPDPYRRLNGEYYEELVR